MPKTILALTRYGRLGASSRVRILQYIPALEAQGFTIRVQPLLDDEDLRSLYSYGRRSWRRLLVALSRRLGAVLRTRGADIVWLQQELFPFLPYAIEAAALAGQKLAIDFDDAQHLFYKESPARRLFYRNKIEQLMRRADVVIVGSPHMGEIARNAGARNVQLVFSSVDTHFFPPAANGPTPFTVGWIGTPMTAGQSLHIIREPLARFLTETNTQAVFIGMDNGQFPDVPGERIMWSEATERNALSSLSVGLCPLVDNPWGRGKSGYKIIQYMAAAKATLASPVGIAADIVEDGVTGFHCRSSDDWYRRLHQLHRDTDLLRALGERGRRRAEVHYDSSIAAEKLTTILEACLP